MSTRRVEYEYRGKGNRFKLIECDKQIATVCEVYEEDRVLKIRVISEGMTYAEICENFPPSPSSIQVGMEYCLADLIAAIIWEAARDGTTLEEGGKPTNIRHFWYTHLKFVIEDILKCGETPSVKGAINTAWGNLINSGEINYEDMKIESAKENVRRSFIKDSPFSNLLIAVEKENLFETFAWIPQLFNCTLITAGGQPSRAVSRNQARNLVEEMKASGVDIDKTIYMCAISDCDPAGYFIQENFRSQLESALRYYGSEAQIKIERLFVKPEQITPELLKLKAMKCEDVNAKSESAKKAEATKWQSFCEATRTKANPEGGLYKIGPDGKKYRAKLELEAFPNVVIERNILEELLRVIRETSDESLIMIPEVMRIFAMARQDVTEETFNRHKDDWLQPVIDKFLASTDELREWFTDKTAEEKQEEDDRHEEVVDPIKEKYQEQRNESESTAQEEEDEQQEVIDEFKEKQGYDVRLQEIEDEIARLEAERDTINEDVKENCLENFEEIDAAWARHEDRTTEIDGQESDELEPFVREHEKNLATVEKRGEYRQAKLEEFKRWKEADFNPVEQELKQRVADALKASLPDYRYRAIEGDGRTKPHVAKLLRNPDELLENDVSAWDQESPVFTEKNCLAKAAMAKDITVEPHRRGFTEDFIDAMREIIRDDSSDVAVEYPPMPEMEEFQSEIDELKVKVEKDIEDGNMDDDKDDDKDDDSDEEK